MGRAQGMEREWEDGDGREGEGVDIQ